MAKYYKTNGIYKNCDHIRLDVCYEKGIGYIAEVIPCHKDDFSYGITYCSEYFNYYEGIKKNLIQCGRKSEKKLAEACKLAEQKAKDLIQSYVDAVSVRGGRHIEILEEIQ